MKVRILTGLCLAAVSIPVLIFSQYIVYPIFLSLLCFIATHEMLRVFKKEKCLEILIPSLVLSLAYPMMPYFVLGAAHPEYGVLLLVFGIFVYMFYLFTVGVAHKGKMPLAQIFSVFTMESYIWFAFSALCFLRYLPYGLFQFLLVFVTAWGCDILAYFVGTFIGKHKLIVEVSPKKTVEGAIGGIVGTLVLVMLYGFLVDRFTDAEANYIVLAVLGLVLPVISQVGDLIASLIKREVGIKDYGRIFPGHGGVMDRFDSILAVSIAMLIVTMLVPPFH